MAERKKHVKPTPLVVCATCGQALPADDVARPRRSTRRIFIDAILAALEKGPATPREIEDRIGMRYSERTANFMRILERQGKVRVVMRVLSSPGNHTFLWALVIDPEGKPRSVEAVHDGEMSPAKTRRSRP